MKNNDSFSAATVWVMYICTGKYDIFWKDFYTSSEKFFLSDCEVHYFVFTDAESIYAEEGNDRVHRIHQESLGWPDNTLMRFHIFLSQKARLEKMDYLVFFNANMKFLSQVSADEFLPSGDSNFLGVQHPWFFNKKRSKFTFERNPNSTAFIPDNEWTNYFQWALQWWKSRDFLSACETMSKAVDLDKHNGLVAVWHDESHWNRFLANRTDIRMLSPSYAYPEDWRLPFVPKILMLDKSKIFKISSVKWLTLRSIIDITFRFLKRKWII